MKKFRETGRKISSMLLILLMCITLLPVGVFADDETDVQGRDEVAAEIQDQDIESSDIEQPVIEEDLDDVKDAPECAHESLKRIPAVKAKCNKEGVKEHYQCTECGAKFFDASATEAADDSALIIPVDPEAHEFGEWGAPKYAEDGETKVITRTCGLCGYTEAEEYIEPIDPGKQAKKFKLDGATVQFKSAVCTSPDDTKGIIPGRVWIKGQKTCMKVNWVNPDSINAIDGIIILRATGTDKVYKEVARLQFKKFKNGEPVINARTAYNDKTAKKANTPYTYRVISYFELDDITYISHLSKSDWAAGQLSTSKLKNVYSANINKSSAKLQSKGAVTLKVTIPSPKTKFKASSRRWSSNNKKVAVVSSKGKVTAKAPGHAVITCRLASGYEVTSKITVKGAFKPGTPKLQVDYATTSSITLKWSKAKYATSYDVYKSDDGLHWDKTPKNTKGLTVTYKGLTKNHRYTFYVVARNDHPGVDRDGNATTYTALGDNSNVLNQKAVVKRRPMTLTGWPSAKSQITGTTLTVTIKINPPLNRKAELQMKSGKKWVTSKSIRLPKGSSKTSVSITFPNTWWDKTTEWRLVVPPTTTTSGFTTGTLKVTSTRAYQNPSSYVQISDTIGKHGYSYYVSPVLVNGRSTKSDHVEALIKTARKYVGDSYVQSRSGAPGNGIDESGLVIQACYGAGVDLWPISPSTRPYNCVPNIMNSKLGHIKFKHPEAGSTDYPNMTRGDLVFFSTTKGGTPIHVAIYTGNGNVLHADPIKGRVNYSTIEILENKKGKYGDHKYFVVAVRRVFN